jgi:hypothetical protein
VKPQEFHGSFSGQRRGAFITVGQELSSVDSDIKIEESAAIPVDATSRATGDNSTANARALSSAT